MSGSGIATVAPLSPTVFLSTLNAMWVTLNVWSLANCSACDGVTVWARRRSWFGVLVAVGIEIFALYPIWREAAHPARVAGLLSLIMTLGVGTAGWSFAQWRVVRLAAAPQTAATTCSGTAEIDCTP